MRLIEEREIVEICQERALLETDLCYQMYQIYNGEFIGDLRELAAIAVEQICGLGMRDGGKYKDDWNSAIQDAGKNLAVWGYAGLSKFSGADLNVENLLKVLDKMDQWTAADIGDLIRLFGGVIEDKELKNKGEVGVDVDQYRDSQRRGGKENWGKDARTRRNVSDGATYDQEHDSELSHIAAAHNAALAAKRAQGFSGFAKIILNDNSTVKKIDSAFGLAEGCDISGTTADTVFFFRHVNGFIAGMPGAVPDELLPVIQLLPMATMASQGHHTILECALTLTLNEIIRYRIGFYSTLMPKWGSPNPRLQVLFNQFEDHPWNKHILCWIEDGTRDLKGYLYDQPEEINELRKASLADQELLSQFKSLPPKAERDHLFRLHRLMGMKRFARLAGVA